MARRKERLPNFWDDFRVRPFTRASKVGGVVRHGTARDFFFFFFNRFLFIYRARGFEASADFVFSLQIWHTRTDGTISEIPPPITHGARDRMKLARDSEEMKKK